MTCNKISFKRRFGKTKKQFTRRVVIKHLFLQENEHSLVLGQVDLGLKNGEPALLEGISSASEVERE